MILGRCCLLAIGEFLVCELDFAYSQEKEESTPWGLFAEKKKQSSRGREARRRGALGMSMRGSWTFVWGSGKEDGRLYDARGFD